MNWEKFEFGPVVFDDVCIGLEDPNISDKRQHFHPYWELKVYKFNGRARIAMSPPGEVHGETPAEFLHDCIVLHCQEPMLGLSVSCSSSNSPKHYFLPWNEADALCPGGLLRLIEMIVHAKKRNSNLRLLNALLETLWSVIYQLWENSRERPARVLSLPDMARYYIERNYFQAELSVAEVAAHLGVTAGHLANLFKQDGPTTIRQHIVKVRMNHALRLLRSGRYTVKEVADMTGWNCQFYFSNCFRQHFNVPPSRAATIQNDVHTTL